MATEKRDRSDRLRRALLDAAAAEEAQHRAQARADLGLAPRAQLGWLLRFAYGEGASDARRLSGADAWALVEKARELVRVATDGRWEAEGRPLRCPLGEHAGGPRGVGEAAAERPSSPRLTPEDRGAVSVAVPVFTPQHAADITAAQTAVREVVEAIAAGQPGFLFGAGGLYQPGTLTKSRASDEVVLAGPPAGITTQARVYWEREGGRLAVRTTIRAKLSDALRVAAVVLISNPPIMLVRRCAWNGCGRVFIGRRGNCTVRRTRRSLAMPPEGRRKRRMPPSTRGAARARGKGRDDRHRRHTHAKERLQAL